MNIAFVTTFDARDPRRGSGAFSRHEPELARQGHTLHYVGPLPVYRYPPGSKLPFAGCTKSSPAATWPSWTPRGPPDRPDGGPTTGRRRLRPAADQRRGGGPVTPPPPSRWSCTPTSRSPTITASATCLTPGWPAFRRWRCGWPGRRCAPGCGGPTCAFSRRSGWPTRRPYGVDPARVRLIPFGANIDDPGRDPAEQRRLNPGRQQFDLLFVGKDWARKGDVAVAVARRCSSVGSTPPCTWLGCSIPAGGAALCAQLRPAGQTAPPSVTSCNAFTVNVTPLSRPASRKVL